MNILNGIRTYGGLAVHNLSPCTLGTVWWNNAGFINGAKKVYTMTGLEKVSKSLISTLLLASVTLRVNGAFAEVLKSLKDQKDFYYGVQFIDNIGKLLRYNQLTQRVEFKNYWELDVVEVLLTIGSCLQAGKYLQKQKVFSFQQCTDLANKMGQYKLFTYRPFTCLCETPKDFFLFVASSLDVARSVKLLLLPSGHNGKNGRPMMEWIRESIYSSDVAQRHIIRRRQVSTENLLKQIGNMGKMYLVWNGGPDCETKLHFAIANFITQNVSLFSYLIKAH